MFIPCSGWISLFLLLLYVITSASFLQNVSVYIILACVATVLLISIYLELGPKLKLISPEGRQDHLYRNLIGKEQ